MRSPRTGRTASIVPCERGDAEEEWYLVGEGDGTDYFASRDLLGRCERYPLRPPTAASLFERVRSQALEGVVPAIVKETEELSLVHRVHRGAAPSRVCCLHRDPRYA